MPASLATGMHSKMTGTVGDLYLTLADDVDAGGTREVPDRNQTAQRSAGVSMHTCTGVTCCAAR